MLIVLQQRRNGSSSKHSVLQRGWKAQKKQKNMPSTLIQLIMKAILLLLVLVLFSNININIVTLISNQLIICEKVLLEFVKDKNDTIGISNKYSNHSDVYGSESSDTYRKIIDVHCRSTAMVSHSKTLIITDSMIEVSKSDIINSPNHNNNCNDYEKNNNNHCETRTSNNHTNINIFSGNSNNSNAALNSSIIVRINIMLVNDICTNIKLATNHVQGFEKLKSGKNIQ